MTFPPLREVWAAVLTHLEPSGAPDVAAIRRNVDLAVASGFDGVVLNGATGEYPALSPHQFRSVLTDVSDAVRGRCRFLAGIGSASVNDSIAMGHAAFEAGAAAALLPPPHFFRYSQEDVAEWCRQIARALPGPVLLYNLPQFTNPLTLETVRELLAEGCGIEGIKDSSGSLDILRALTAESPEVRRIVGNDAVLVQGRREEVASGVISGVAGVLPELVALLAGRPEVDEQRYSAAILLMNDYLDQLKDLPVPWGLKWTAEFRGLAPARFAQPLSAGRQAQGKQFSEWLEGWWAQAVPVLNLPQAVSR